MASTGICIPVSGEFGTRLSDQCWFRCWRQVCNAFVSGEFGTRVRRPVLVTVAVCSGLCARVGSGWFCTPRLLTSVGRVARARCVLLWVRGVLYPRLLASVGPFARFRSFRPFWCYWLSGLANLLVGQSGSLHAAPCSNNCSVPPRSLGAHQFFHVAIVR